MLHTVWCVKEIANTVLIITVYVKLGFLVKLYQMSIYFILVVSL